MTRRFKQPIWIFPLVIAAVVAVFGFWANSRLRQIVEEQVQAKLVSTLDANVTALGIWTKNQTRLASSVAEEPEVQKLATRIINRSMAVGPENRRPSDLQDAELLGSYLRPRLNRLGYAIGQLVNTNFVVGGNSGRGRMGVGLPVSDAHTNKFAELFASGEPILITPFKPDLPERRPFARPDRTNQIAHLSQSTNRPSLRWRGGTDFPRRRGDLMLMQVAAPIREGKEILGALALVINPTNEFSRILSVARTGETGETYAFDQTGLLISESRFDAQLQDIGLLTDTNSGSALNLRLHDPGADLTRGFKTSETNLSAQPLIRLVAGAVENEDGVDVTPSRDYRGVPVVGAWRWLPQLGFGVATQIDAAEAYRPLRVLQLIFVILFLLLVLCAISMLLFSYSNVTWRKRLTEAQLKLKQLGQYTLEEKIGEGGMGTVYRARHALMRRDTAVKLLSPDRADAAAIERFEREVCLTCQLTHPNTIQVYDYGHTPEGIFYYAMEYLRGLNLQQLVTRFGPQPEGRVIHILSQVCDSLAEAHALGLVHRDIKPANIFLCDRGGIPDSVKVLDFGLVREYNAESQDRSAGKEEFVGTPCFMPLEAFENSGASDPRSDIYSLGAVAYYLLTGHFVFESESIAEIHRKHLNETITPPSERSANRISPELETLILRCLNSDPQLRPQSALELRTLLLATPHAGDSTLESRADWWSRFGQSESVQNAEPTSLAAIDPARSTPTVKIDLNSRMR